MPRPKIECNIEYCPSFSAFSPNGGVECECVDISAEEIESLRLKNIKNLDQTEAAKKMGISQSTFQRILASAYKKVSLALVEGMELKIVKKSNS